MEPIWDAGPQFWMTDAQVKRAQERDPTYEKDAINDDPVFRLAFELSEAVNDFAPMGWGDFIPLARHLIDNYNIERKG